MTTVLRTCILCGKQALTEDDLNLFSKNDESLYGRRNVCYQCENKRHRLRRQKNREINPYPYRKRANKYNSNLKTRVLEKLEQFKCSKCGEEDINLLSIDHIKNNGNEERKKHQHDVILIKILNMSSKNAKENYQILCRNCNWEKHIIENEKNPFYHRKIKAMNKLSDSPYCVECGVDDVTVLTIDHIHNDGYKETTEQVYTSINRLSREEARKEYQILCRNCNYLKYLESSR